MYTNKSNMSFTLRKYYLKKNYLTKEKKMKSAYLVYYTFFNKILLF